MAQQGPLDNPYNIVTIINNAVFDEIMPALSSEGWKVLCVAMRETWRRNATALTLRHFLEKTGIPEPRTVELALQECTEAGYLIALDEGHYTLNIAYGTGADVREEPQEPEPKAEDELSSEMKPAHQALLSFGQEMGVEPDTSETVRAMQGNDAVSVMAWIATGRLMTHLDKGARFQTVLDRLQQNAPPLPMAMLAQDAPDVVGDAAPAPLSAGDADPEALWASALEVMEGKMRSSKFKFLKPTQGVALEDGVLVVAAPSARVKEWLESGVVSDVIEDTFHEVIGESMALRFVVEES